jgi:SSS family transporter
LPNPISALAILTAPTHLRAFDLALVAVYLIGITLFGLRFRKKTSTGAPDRSLRSYFLANNTIPWWAISLSIVSAETSTLTIISIPGVAFAGDFGFLQIVLGYMLGRIVVAALFLPRYFSGNMLTAYQLIDNRFGSSLHKVTAGLFLLTRAAAEGVRVFAVSIVVGIAIGTRDILSIGIITALTLLYTFEGGLAAVIWTDVVQMAIYIGGTIVAIATLGSHVSGGWTTIHTVAYAAGKFHMLNFALNLTTTYTFWAGILGGTFLTMASHGTDQLMVQRMLAARNLRESQLALLSSGAVIFLQFALFLLIGAGLYVFYGQHPTSFTSSDRIFPTFIVREMPIGIAGLLVAAILAAAMSNLSAALNSLSSTTVVDFYMHLRPHADDRERNLISKSSTLLWALVLFAIAIYSAAVGGKGHVVEIGLSIASVAYGCLLGVFLLGTLTRFATQTGATIGMICGFVVNLWLWQGTFPMHLGTITIPHIAFTWYVLIGAAATFLIGSLASLLFRKQSTRTVTASLLLLFLLSFPKGICVSAAAQTPAAQAPDFTPITTLITNAIAAHKLPGAVVLIGHNNHIVFEQAYGVRKVAGEPSPQQGPDGQPDLSAEPMTEDTIFDMASLSKCLSTATAIMQLYEAGKITSFDDPIEKYLPLFNPQHDPARASVTLRMLLTHTSGEAPDVDLKDSWGLIAPDRDEGLRLALTTPLKAAPGSTFEYSDINFILLGYLVEVLSGQPLDVYAHDHIFYPLSMTDTRYLPLNEWCGPAQRLGSAMTIPDKPWPYEQRMDCLHHPDPRRSPTTVLIPRIAPTAHDNEGTAATNPDFDHLLRGTVHDPTTRRMGGVAGHAGVFSTAQNLSRFAQTLLDKLTRDTGSFPLKQSTLQLMTNPEQPGHNPNQIAAANTAEQSAINNEPGAPSSPTAPSSAKVGPPTIPGLAPHYPAIKDQNLRGFGWDIDTAFSKPRGMLFPIGSFGHTGFTGTSLWMDPASNTYVILLANAIHPRGNPPISTLRGQIATAAAQALSLYSTQTLSSRPDPEHSEGAVERPVGSTANATTNPVTIEARPDCNQPNVFCDPTKISNTLTGIDVLEQTHFAALTNLHHIGLLTNQSGLDHTGRRTIDILNALPTTHYSLTTLFSPEHGINGALDQSNIASTTDPTTHLPVISLYGAHDADRRPTHDQLKDLDAVVIDLQDAGVRFWTYEAAVGYFLEAASTEQTQYHHDLQIILLDRPNLIGGTQTQGPVSDPGTESYVNYMPLPIRHGLTLGELARYIVGTKHLSTNLTVIPMQHWHRTDYFTGTGLPWINPSPNLRSPEAAILYPALGLIETTNLSVGRGTAHPFSLFGAGVSPQKPGAPSSPMASSSAKVGSQDAWFDAEAVAAALTARNIPGATFTASTEPIADDANHYPFHGQTIPAVEVSLTDPTHADTPELGIEILSVLHRLYPTQFHLEKSMTLLCNRATLDALQRGDDPRAIAATWQSNIQSFKQATNPYLLYP